MAAPGTAISERRFKVISSDPWWARL